MSEKKRDRFRTPKEGRLSSKSTYLFLRLKELPSKKVRNTVRGILSSTIGAVPDVRRINNIRADLNAEELCQAIAFLFGRDGPFPLNCAPESYRKLLVPHQLSKLESSKEIAFVAGHLNGWSQEVCEIVGAMESLKDLPEADPDDALEALRLFAERWGASNYLVKKVAFASSVTGKSRDVSMAVSRIGAMLEQPKHSVPYFSALEALDDEFNYFPGVYNRIRLLEKYRGNDFRQILPLLNIVPSILDLADIGPSLRKAHSMSMVDEVVAFTQIIHSKDDWPEAYKQLRRHLDPKLLSALEALAAINIDSAKIVSDVPVEHADLSYYRRCSAFLEFGNQSRFRRLVDRVLVNRLLGKTASVSYETLPQFTLRDLTKSLNGFRPASTIADVQNSGVFMRTIWFLVFVERKEGALYADHNQIKSIFNKTTALDILLTDDEIEKIYATCDEQSRPLVSVLALALYKGRSHDEDVDFKFRFSFCQAIISQFGNDVASFVEWLIPSAPEVANFMISVLDIVTIQKMYWVVKNAGEAARIRQNILRIVGKNRNNLDYFVEADNIEARIHVSKLQKYFDDSRMYVDGHAMKQWLIDNPSAYLQQYLTIIERSSDAGGDSVAWVVAKGASNAELQLFAAYDYILVDIAKSAFKAFCVSEVFGIESYLGRRIRHNTLSGMMRDGVENLLEKPVHRVLLYDAEFKKAYTEWIEDYKGIIESLRREYLQFKSQLKPKGIFVSDIDVDTDQTKNNLAVMRNVTFTSRNAELFREMLIRFCWQEIDPQLNAAARFISFDTLNDAKERIVHHLGMFTDETHRMFVAELQEAVHARFTRLASWFRQPESGFVTASVRELADLIYLEASNLSSSHQPRLNFSGEGADLKLYGLSVHRVYDCLSVLIRNAIDHGNPEKVITLEVLCWPAHQGNVAMLRIAVTSELTEESKGRSLERLKDCFEDSDISRSMLREGYSGIKKLRYITLNSEGQDTAAYNVEGNQCTVHFKLVVETATDSEAS